jgi:hypothetical protein
MLDQITIFVIGFFVGYLVLFYARPAFVTRMKDGKTVLAYDKLFLTAILIGLISTFTDVLFD